MSRKTRELPSREVLIARFNYRDGCLFWKVRPQSDFMTAKAAKIWNVQYPVVRAGSPMTNGYRMVAMDGTKFLEHRLIYQMMIGPVGENRVDHIDQDFRNNKHSNLRLCSHAENLMNQPGRRGSDGLPKHVYWSVREKKFKVSMRASGQRHYLGTYKTLEEAASVALAARERFHGRFSDHRSGV